VPVADGNGVLSVFQEMASQFEKVQSLTSDVNVLYFGYEGREITTYKLRYYYKKPNKFRVEFIGPFKGVTVFYRSGEDSLTVKPVSFLPGSLRLSIDNSLVKTPSGQRIDQTDWRYFLQFIEKNADLIQNRDSTVTELGDQLLLSFFAMDHVESKDLEKYVILVSKETLLPLCVERFDLEERPIDITVFKKQVTNTNLEDEFFEP
jgi:outer membrane lipoprotein-sorting protein